MRGRTNATTFYHAYPENEREQSLDGGLEYHTITIGREKTVFAYANTIKQALSPMKSRLNTPSEHFASL